MPAALPVVLDASVVVPYNLTDFWLRADMLGLLRVHWSEEILAETELEAMAAVHTSAAP